MEKNMMNPLKVFQKGNEKTNSLIKSDGKLNCGELSFFQEMPGNISRKCPQKFFWINIKGNINYFCIQYGMFWAGSQIRIKNSTQSWNP